MGTRGLFRAYQSVEFLAPVFAGDYIEARGKITRVGKTSRDMEFEARKVIRPLPSKGGKAVSSAEVLSARRRMSGQRNLRDSAGASARNESRRPLRLDRSRRSSRRAAERQPRGQARAFGLDLPKMCHAKGVLFLASGQCLDPNPTSSTDWARRAAREASALSILQESEIIATPIRGAGADPARAASDSRSRSSTRLELEGAAERFPGAPVFEQGLAAAKK